MLVRVYKLFLVATGCSCVVLATIGVFVPGLPTVPFVLAASFCFARSSKKFHRRLRNNRWFGPALIEWEESRSISRRTKVVAIATIAAGISLSVFIVPLLAVRISLTIIGILVSLFLITRPETSC